MPLAPHRIPAEATVIQDVSSSAAQFRLGAPRRIATALAEATFPRNWLRDGAHTGQPFLRVDLAACAADPEFTANSTVICFEVEAEISELRRKVDSARDFCLLGADHIQHRPLRALSDSLQWTSYEAEYRFGHHRLCSQLAYFLIGAPGSDLLHLIQHVVTTTAAQKAELGEASEQVAGAIFAAIAQSSK